MIYEHSHSSAVSFSYNIHCCFLVFTLPPSLSSYFIHSHLHVGRPSLTSFSPLRNLSSNLHLAHRILRIAYPDVETRHYHDV